MTLNASVDTELVRPDRKAVARNEWIDLLRIFAAFGIVWFHSKAPGYSIGHYGLSIFIVIAVYLRLTREHQDGDISRIANRLLVPWAFWFTIFALINLGQGQTAFASGILAGPSLHLWFLPWMAAVLIGLTILPPALVLFCAALPLLLVDPTPPFAQWGHAFIPLLIGVCLAGIYTTLPPVTLGLGISAISPMMLGVYLTHPIFAFVVRSAGYDQQFIGAVITFAATLAFVAMAHWLWPSFAERVL